MLKMCRLSDPIKEGKGSQILFFNQPAPNAGVSEGSPIGAGQKGLIEDGEVLQPPAPRFPRLGQLLPAAKMKTALANLIIP